MVLHLAKVFPRFRGAWNSSAIRCYSMTVQHTCRSGADAVANQVPRIGPRVGGARRRCPLGSVSVAGDEEEISVPNTARTGFTVDFDVRQGSLRKSFSRLWVSLFEPMMQTKRRGWRVDSEVPRCSPSRAPMSISKNGLGMARDFLQ